MWSWAVTSSRDLGRLVRLSVCEVCSLVYDVSYYFSTHGCSLFFSGCAGVFDEVAAAAASFWRALISKKLAIVSVVVSVASLLSCQRMRATFIAKPNTRSASKSL